MNLPSMSLVRRHPAVWGVVASLALAAASMWVRAADKPAAATKPALTVLTTVPQLGDWPQTLSATGSIAAWQEAVIGAEIGGLRLTEVLVNVGDTVQRGQLLARLQGDTVGAELAQTQAGVAEADANVAEAKANADRARQLQSSGAISAQQINQYLTAEQTARARALSLRARLQADQLRLGQTRIVAPDRGVISARLAAVGGVVQPGQELFRLIRQQRLEWRAEVPAADLPRLRPGIKTVVTSAAGVRVPGRVRMVAPTVDAQTRNGLVYVDLMPSAEAASGVKAGMFARGEFELAPVRGLSLPQGAVQLRDGFAYVYRVGTDNKVVQTKVALGRRFGDRVEIVGGLDPKAVVVAGGVGFLADGDTVRVAGPAPAAAAASAAVASR
jgi:RND family efflux transporter MFP subunit